MVLHESQLRGYGAGTSQFVHSSLEDGWVQLMISRDQRKTRFPRIHCAYETTDNGGVLVVPRETQTRDVMIRLSDAVRSFRDGRLRHGRTQIRILWAMERILEANARTR